MNEKKELANKRAVRENAIFAARTGPSGKQAGFPFRTLPAAIFDKYGRIEKDGLKPLETEIPAQSACFQHQNPCARVLGPGAARMTCGECKHSSGTAYIEHKWSQKTGYKRRPEIACALRTEAGFEHLSWPPSTPSCARFEPIGDTPPVNSAGKD